MKIKIITLALIFSVLFSVPASALESNPAKPVSTDDIVFFGDSTTAHMKLRGGIPEERVWSGKANTVLFSTVNDICPIYFPDENRAVTLAEAVRIKKPKILVITLGVSGGAGFVPESEFKKIYEKMILTVRGESPDTIIFVQSILPLSDKSVKHYGKLTKNAVVTANGWIKDVCEALCIPYINTHDLLTDENGYLKPVYQNDEYMHLTRAAYEIIISNVFSFAEKNCLK